MLILYSPLPNANTGTAAYLLALLRDLRQIFGPGIRDKVLVAIDSSAQEDQKTTAQSDGWRVADFRSFNRASDDVCVYFLASNRYHYYCYEQFATHRLGRRISVIHDLSAGFFIREMASFSLSPYESLIHSAFSEGNGVRAKAIIRDFDRIHDVTRNFISAQAVTLVQSELVLTHSYYAKSRLILDNELEPNEAKKIIVCDHPVPIIARSEPPSTTSSAAFTAASFGYYSPSKRFDSVIKAWDQFLDSVIDPAACDLILGGEIPRKEQKRLHSLCRPCFRSTIKFCGFLTEERLHTHLKEIDLLIALRFPTCGETSGLVAHANAHRTAVAVSDFAAFREDSVAYRISVCPNQEIDDLAQAIRDRYESKIEKRAVINKYPAWCGMKRRVSDVLASFIGTKQASRDSSFKIESKG